MYYELYIDIFFLVNFIIDFILLSVIKKLLKHEGGIMRRIVAAIAGSGMLCIYLITDLRLFNILLLYIFICSAMILIAFRITSLYGFIKNIVALYVAGWCFNGICSQMVYKIDYFWQILVCSLLVYIGFCFIRVIYSAKKINEKPVYEVEIYINNHIIVTNGIWDTGNCLISPYHHKGVSIIEYKVCRKYLTYSCISAINLYLGLPVENMAVDTSENHEDIQVLHKGKIKEKIQGKISDEKSINVFAVPYKTINSSNGILPVIQTDKITVKKDGENLDYPGALLGIVDNCLSSKGDYHMILTTNN